MMKRVFALVYGIICYLVFLASFLWMILFLGDFEAWAPATINSGDSEIWPALLINLVLVALFGFQHTLMARWMKFIPEPLKRSTYILISSMATALLLWFWQPISKPVWQIEATWALLIVQWGFWLGWLILLLSTFMINHFDLFGLKQVYDYNRNNVQGSPEFFEPGFYNYVRQPLMVGFIIAFWSTPVMTVGHLLFSLGMTAYIVISIYFEDKVLAREFGDKYKSFRSRVPKFFPRLKSK